jgi:hypothetical protein
MPQFTQIDNYDSLIFEIKFPVQSWPNLEKAARNHLDSRRLAAKAKAFLQNP